MKFSINDFLNGKLCAVKLDLNYSSSLRGIPLTSYFTTRKSPDMCNIFNRKSVSVLSKFDFSLQFLYKKKQTKTGIFKNVFQILKFKQELLTLLFSLSKHDFVCGTGLISSFGFSQKSIITSNIWALDTF